MLKRFSHNNTPELNILLIAVVICIPIVFVANTVTLFIVLACILISLVWYLCRNSKFNKDRFF